MSIAIIAIFSLASVVLGGIVILALGFALARSGSKKRPPVVSAVEPRAQVEAAPLPTPMESVLIDDDYEREAVSRRSVAVAPTASMPSILVERLEELAVNRPLPIPVAPPGVEPIPELEPTEIMRERPPWATGDWARELG